MMDMKNLKPIAKEQVDPMDKLKSPRKKKAPPMMPKPMPKGGKC